MTLTVTNTFTNGTVADADEVNQNFTDVTDAINENHASQWYNDATTGSVDNVNCIYAVTATTFVGLISGVVQTGVLSGNTITWTARTTAFSINGIAQCDADPTLFIAYGGGSPGKTTWSTDSGVNWTDSGTAGAYPADNQNVADVHFFSSSLAILAGDEGAAGKAGWVSTDGGDNWSKIGTGGAMTSNTRLCHMFDATNGFFLDTSNNIWFFDGVDTVTDSNDQVGIQTGALYALSATTFLRASGSKQDGNADGEVYYWADGANEVEMLRVDMDNSVPSNIVKAADGNYYIVYVTEEAPDGPGLLIKITDPTDHTTYTKRQIFWGNAILSNGRRQSQLAEYTTGKLIYSLGFNKWIIDI